MSKRQDWAQREVAKMSARAKREVLKMAKRAREGR